MNTYKIIFTREDGTQGTDHFAAINERQARKDFGECYRHSTATIISIELASTNAPATKQQERDTLEKIRKMVEQLGPDSYLATAFEGCFDLAAENIDNDWACSMADRARNAEKRVAELEDKLSEAVKDYEAAHAAAHAVAEEKDAEIAKLKDQLNKHIRKANADCETSMGSMYLSRRIDLKRKTNGTLISCFLYVNSHYFERRECISFNADGWIGFAGWADQGNTNPILRAFIEWCDALAATKEKEDTQQ